MKTAEEILDLIIVNDIPFLQHVDNDSELHRLLLLVIRVAQKESYNEALEDAAKNADVFYVPEEGCATGDYYEVDKQSILKLKK